MVYESFLELVKKRRSIRSFKPDPIPDEYVNKIIEAARWAPSGANSQPWEFIVIKNGELKEKILQFHHENSALTRRMELTREKEMVSSTHLRMSAKRPGFMEAPVWIILAGDERTKKAYPISVYMRNGGEKTFNSSLATAFIYMHLAAASLGLGSQWVSSVSSPYMQCLIKNLLMMPEELHIYDMMAVGYPLEQPRSRIVREKNSMLHQDRYDRLKTRSDEEIFSFIKSLRQ